MPRLRKIGIGNLGDMSWGTHLCLFYEATEDLFDAVVPYFRAGLEDNEFCVWAVSDPVTEEDAKAALRQGIPDFDEYFAAGSIEIISGSEWFLKGGRLDLNRATGGWRKKLHDALKRGYSGMRASSNVFWIEMGHREKFAEYERLLDEVLAGQPHINFLCTYAVPACGAADLLDVVRAHKFMVARRDGKWEFLECLWTDHIKRRTGPEEVAVSALASLAPRESEVLMQLTHGAKNKEIAARLGISERTVEVYRGRLLLKTKARNVQELVRLAILGGIDRQTTRATTRR